MKKINLKNQSGVTIIEVIVTIFVFSVAVILISGIFIRMLSLQRRALASQEVQENSLFIFELMAREIRVSNINGPNANCNNLSNNLIIDHPTKGQIHYSLSNGRVRRSDSGGLTELNSTNVEFTELGFCIDGAQDNDNDQARVTIIAAMTGRKGNESVTLNVQTTISSRDLSEELGD